jgi:serine/threonine protein kinase/predicted Zn-dependent protease
VHILHAEDTAAPRSDGRDEDESAMIGKTLGPYRLLSELGAGGMGRVFLAEDIRLGRKVALKVLHPDAVGDPERKRRFITEARAASALNHPHILAIYDVGESDGLDFIAMEHVEGETLQERIRNAGPLPFKTIARIGAQLASALTHAHEAGVVHRDIKPANIKLSREGHVKILDFGLAKLIEGKSSAPGDSIVDGLTRTVSGQIIGSPQYMSPEQARGSSLDGRSDIFSLGSVLYELAVGSPPFPAESLVDVLHAIVHDPSPPIRQRVHEAPAELERIVTKCLEKDPTDRYQHADDLAVDLRRLQDRLDAGTDLTRASSGVEGRSELDGTASRIAIQEAKGGPLEPAPPPVEKQWRVAPFLFENATADSDLDWLEHAVPSLIGFDLEQDPSIDAEAGLEYAQMRENGLSRAADLAMPVLRKLAADFNYEHYLVGRLQATDDGLSISAFLHVTKNARQVATRTDQVRSEEGVLTLVDSLCVWLRGALGIPADHIEGVPFLPVSEIATRSIGALRAFTQGRIAIGLREDWSAGIPHLERAVAEDPRFAWAELSLQIALLLANRGEESKKVLRSLMKNRHRLPERYQFRAALDYHRMKEEPEKALQVARHWTELYPRDPAAFLQLSFAYGGLEQETEELGALQMACALAPDRPALLLSLAQCLERRGRHEEALSSLDKHVRNCPKDSEALTLLGEVLHALGRPAEARAQDEKALAIKPNDVGIRMHLADLDSALGRFPEALEQFEEALEEAETPEQRATIHDSLSFHFVTRGQLTRAIEHSEQALVESRSFSTSISLFTRRISSLPMYVMAGRSERALELLAALESEMSPPWDQLLPLAHVLVRLELEDAVKAREQLPALQKATTLPYLRGMHRAIAIVCANLAELEGQHAAALEEYRRAIELNPRREVWRYQLARCYRKCGRLREAEEVLAQVFCTSPVHPEAHLECARVCHELGRPADAIEHLGIALSVWEEADPQYRPSQEAQQLRETWSRARQ